MARSRKPKGKSHERRHGQGSVHQLPSGNWRATTPRPARRSAIFPTKAEAEAWLAPAESRSTTGPEQPLGQYLRDWYRGRILAGQTTHYARAIRYAAPLYDLALADLTTQHFQQLFADWLKRSPRVRKDGKSRGLALSTVGRLREVLSSALRAAVPRLIPENPIARTRLPREPRRDVVHWEEADANRFLRAAVGSPLAAFFGLGLRIGARPGELRGLRWSDLQLDRGTVLIRRSVEVTTLRVRDQTKSAAEREVALPPPCVAELRRHRAAQRVVSEYVFCAEEGRPLTAYATEREFARVRRLAGVPPMKLYGLRHTAATTALDRGVPLPTVSQMLGHANPAVTARVYWRSLPSHRAQAARTLAEAFPDPENPNGAGLAQNSDDS